MNGMWVHRRSNDAQFSVPGFIDPAMLDGILPYLPSEEVVDELLDKAQLMDLSVPREVGSQVINKLVAFWRESEAIYRRNASILDSAHQLLAHPTDLRFGSLERIGQKLIGDSSRSMLPTELYAVRKALIHTGFGFGTDSRSHRQTTIFQIRSKEHVGLVNSAVDWIRDFQDDLARRANTSPPSEDLTGPPTEKRKSGAAIVKSFLDKARLRIEHGRSQRAPTLQGSVGPSKVRHSINDSSNAIRDLPEPDAPSWKYSIAEQGLVRFMEFWALSTSFRTYPKLMAVGPTLLRAVGAYDNHNLDQSTAYMFLQEIGVIAPWENRVAFDEHLLLPTSQHSKPLEQLSFKIRDMGKDAETTEFADTMKNLRHDWKDLEVYCIDSATAHEIDDGISLERIAGLPSEYWVHIHVANPTAFINKEHPIARMAAHMTETVYMPERAYTMLPPWLTRRDFSLAPDRPTLTFSARLDSQGNIKDIKIQPGTIRKVISLTPNTLDTILGTKTKAASETILTVGGTPPASLQRQTQTTVTDSQKQDLLTLASLAKALSEQRRKVGGLSMEIGFPDIGVYNSASMPGLPWSHPSRAKPRFYEGDPVIQARCTGFQSWFAAGDIEGALVREMMLMCCQIAAQWCKERNVPIIYRGTGTSSLGADSMSAERYAAEVLQPSLDERGHPPMAVALQYMRLMGQAIVTTTPLPHRFLGVPHYTKVTSPLRRYGDMISHWQIEAALRAEARVGKSIVGATQHDFLPFSRRELDNITIRLQPRERLIRKSMRNSELFWLMQLFFRTVYFNEADIPLTQLVTVYAMPDAFTTYGRINVIFNQYGFHGVLSAQRKHGLEQAEVGDVWEVKISEVNVYHRVVTAEPIRLIRRDARRFG